MRKLGKGMGFIGAVAVAGAVALGAAGLALAQEPDALTALTALTSGAATSRADNGAYASQEESSSAYDNGYEAAPAAETDGATSPAAVKTVKIELTDAANKLTVPYGVDPVAWLNDHLTFDVTTTKSDGTTETQENLKSADVAQYFQDGKVIVRATPEAGQTDVPYPVNQADDQGNLTKAPDWSKSIAVGTVKNNDGTVTYTLPKATDLQATMSWSYKDAGSLETVALAPESVVSSLTQSLNGSGDKAGVVVSGTYKTGDVKLWLDGADLADGKTPVTLHVPDGSNVRLSNGYVLAGDGSFTTDKDADADDKPVTGNGTGYKADATTSVVYLRLEADIPNPEDNTKTDYYKGEVVRVPVKVDTTAPKVTALSLIDANGTEHTLDDLKTKAQNGTVIAPAAGVKLKVSLEDTKPTDAGTKDTEASGLPKKAYLTVGEGDAAKKLEADVQADGSATFTLDSATLGQGTFDVNKMHLSVTDVAGNALDTTADQIEGSLKADAGAPTKLAIYDPANADNADASSVVINGTAHPTTSTEVPYGTSLAASLRIKANDALGLGGLLTPKSYTHTVETVDGSGTGTETKTDQNDALSIDGFTTANGAYKDQALTENLDAEGLHTFTYDVQGADVFLTPLYTGADNTHEVTQQYILDKTAPSATDATYSDAAKLDKDNEISHVTENDAAQKGTYVLGGKRTITVTVKDLLAGKVDKAQDTSGIDFAKTTVTATKYSSEYDKAGTTVNLTASDDGTNDAGGITYDAAAGTVTLHLNDDGLYRLDHITLHLVDKAGNTTGAGQATADVKLSDLVATITGDASTSAHKTEWTDKDGKAIDGFRVITEAKPNVHVTVNGAQDDKVQPYYQTAPEVKVVINDQLFGFFKHTGGDLTKVLTLTGTVTPGESGTGTASVTALTYDDFTKQADGTWTATVKLPGTTDDAAATLEGTYKFTAHYAVPYAPANTSDSTATFVYDKTAPKATEAELTTTFDPAKDEATLTGTKHDGTYAVGGARTIKVSLADILSRGTNDQTNVSGVNPAKVTAIVKRYSGVNDEKGTTTEVPADKLAYDAATKTVTLTLADGGIYPLNDISLRLEDNAGTAETYKLSDVVAGTTDTDMANSWKGVTPGKPAVPGEDGKPETPAVPDKYGTETIDGIVVANTTGAFASVTINGAPDADPAKEEPYKDDPSVTVRVSDPLFAVYQELPDFKPADYIKLTGTAKPGTNVTANQSFANGNLGTAVTPVDGAEAWDVNVTLPTATGVTDAAHNDLESSYSIEAAYTPHGATTPASLGNGTFVIDRSEPTVVDASIDGVKPEEVSDMGDKNYLFGGNRTIKLNVKDLLRGTGTSTTMNAEHTSGIDVSTITVTAKRSAYVDATEAPADVTLVEKGKAAPDAGGNLSFTLTEAGEYDLDKISVQFSDYAGNAYSKTLSDIANSSEALKTAWKFGGDTVISGITVAKVGELKPEDVVFSVTDHNNHQVVEGAWSNVSGPLNVTITINDKNFNVWSHTALGRKDFFSLKLTPGSGSDTAATEEIQGADIINKLTRQKNGTWSYTFTVPASGTGDATDGLYHVKLSYGQFLGFGGVTKEQNFGVDHKAPHVTDATLVEAVDSTRDVAKMEDTDNNVYVIGGQRTLRVRMRDLLRGLAPTNGSEERNLPSTSGIATDAEGKAASVTVSLTRHDGMNLENSKTETTTVNPVVIDEQGWVNVPLTDEGLYLTKDITFQMTDVAGNDSGAVTLADVLKTLPAASQTYWQFGSGSVATGIIVDDPVSKPEAGVDVTDGTNDDGSAIPVSEDPYYHRGNTVVKPWVKDAWFDAYRHSGRGGTFSTNVVMRAGATAPESLTAVNISEMTYNAEQDRWETTYALPLAQAKDKLPVEGDYGIDIAYQGLTGTPEAPEVDPEPVTFGVDYTAPKFGTLNLSEVTPAQWGWIFSTNDENVSVQLTDNLAGMNGETATVEANGNVKPEDLGTTYASTADDYIGRSTAGNLDFSLTEDAQRIYFKGSYIKIRDVAGNEAVVDMGSYVGSNSNIPASWGEEYDPKPYVGISLDKVDPVIEVTYDNNDVRNGQYYNQARTATVTLTESNFDLVKSNDKDREIVVVGRDGQSGQEITAEKFENPSNDGKTWVATYEFKDDADWTMDVSFTDPANHEAESYHTAFIVDTTAPTISVQWDNNEVETGMYYKATRTASISVRERNFSAELASVTTTAADASGASVGAPGDSGWNEASPREEYTDSVYFGNELHYTMKVAVTDLAGNVAEEYNEPEFVIDMTAPVVEVGGVEDHHAYADTVAPTIHYSDTNFEPYLAQTKITGGRRGDQIYFDSEDVDTATTRDTTYADFEHTLENDDVYTLVASVRDKAGNEAQQTVIFSVNRYGSNYVMMDGSGNVLGAYLNQPQDIVVAEINASGLDEAKGRAELTRDTNVTRLQAGADYTVASDQDQWAWNETTYTFPARLFTEDGYYRLILTSTDNAGNLSQNTMDAKNQARDGSAAIDFAKDGTAPRGELMGITSNTVYLDPNKQVSVGVQDNLAIDTAVLTVDGNEVASWSGDDITSGDLAQSLKATGMPVDDQNHDVELVVTDKAGNQARVNANSVMVTGDLVTYVLNTPSVLYAVIGGFVALLTIAGVAIFLSVRHHRLTEDRRNPFGYGAKK